MDFVTVKYFVFLLIVTALFYAVKSKYRPAFIIFSNVIFYSFFGLYFTLIFYTVVLVTYAGGVIVNKYSERQRLAVLWSFVLLISGILVFFKFQKFILIDTTILFPIGLSFLTFKSISYLIEIYRKNSNFDISFVNSFLFLSFFPAIRSGPIDKPNYLISQFSRKTEFDSENVLLGAKLIIWGVFKKVVIADRLAFFVNNIYDNPYNHRGIPLVISTVLYSLQIYYDFSGYTDIAIGSANLMGIKLQNNFNRPYFAKNIQEFWRKWHITLSNWLRDYLFLPISYFLASKFIRNKFTKNKFDILSYSISIFITMLIAGFWHGNGYNFLIWGFLFAFYLTFSRVFRKYKSRFVKITGIKKLPFVYKILQIAVTFSLVSFAWIFFRAGNINEALYIVKNLFSGIGDLQIYLSGYKEIIAGVTEFDNSWAEFIYMCFFILICEVLQINISENNFIGKFNIVYRWSVYFFLIFSILLFGVSHFQKFIYYNF